MIVPIAKGGLSTTSGREAISPIRINEVRYFCPAFAVLLPARAASPKNSLRRNKIITGLIVVISASSITQSSFQNQPPTC